MTKAVILAGGKGTRMSPYTTVLPKPLLPVGDMPILEIMIRQLKMHGVSDIILSVGYLGGLLETYFGTGEKLGVRIAYSYESSPLGTAGPLRLIDNLDETFFVMNGDLLTTLSFSNMLAFHRKNKRIATVGVARKDTKIDFGVIELNPDRSIRHYNEKPTLTHLMSMGIYVFEPEILEYLNPGERFDLPDLVLKIVKAEKAPLIFDESCEWLDIGRPQDYEVAVQVFEDNRAMFLPSGD